MRALQVTQFGQAPLIQNVEMPQPKTGEVRVKIEACGLNFADLLMIKGEYQATPPLPFTLGMEVAGVVDALGKGVDDLAVGDRVSVFGGHGGLALYGCFARVLCTPLPDQMPSTDAAAFQIAYGTSHLALTQRAGLKRGQTLVVLGAAGGVGLTAVEVGAAIGANVIAVARGPDKCAVATAAGANIALDSETVDLKSELRKMGGADVIYDPVGGALGEAALAAANIGALSDYRDGVRRFAKPASEPVAGQKHNRPWVLLGRILAI